MRICYEGWTPKAYAVVQEADEGVAFLWEVRRMPDDMLVARGEAPTFGEAYEALADTRALVEQVQP